MHSAGKRCKHWLLQQLNAKWQCAMPPRGWLIPCLGALDRPWTCSGCAVQRFRPHVCNNTHVQRLQLHRASPASCGNSGDRTRKWPAGCSWGPAGKLPVSVPILHCYLQMQACSGSQASRQLTLRATLCIAREWCAGRGLLLPGAERQASRSCGIQRPLLYCRLPQYEACTPLRASYVADLSDAALAAAGASDKVGSVG